MYKSGMQNEFARSNHLYQQWELLCPSLNNCRFRFPINNFDSSFLINLQYKINIIRQIFESSFLINLFGDTNVGQTCGTETNYDHHLGTEGVQRYHCISSRKIIGSQQLHLHIISYFFYLNAYIVRSKSIMHVSLRLCLDCKLCLQSSLQHFSDAIQED